ncbi:ribose 5-phosphate isomerase A, partial [Pseudoalteromonas carrageenovora]
MTQDELKIAASWCSLEFVKENTIFGVGTGSTVNHFIDAIGTIKDTITGSVSRSEASTARLEALG